MLISAILAGFKFLVYSIYIQKLQVSWIFGGNSAFKFLVYSIYIQYIFNFQVTRILATNSLQIQYIFNKYPVYSFDSANRHKGSDVDLEDYDK